LSFTELNGNPLPVSPHWIRYTITATGEIAVTIGQPVASMLEKLWSQPTQLYSLTAKSQKEIADVQLKKGDSWL